MKRSSLQSLVESLSSWLVIFLAGPRAGDLCRRSKVERAQPVRGGECRVDPREHQSLTRIAPISDSSYKMMKELIFDDLFGKCQIVRIC